MGLSKLVHVKRIPAAGNEAVRNFNALNSESGPENPHYDDTKKKKDHLRPL